jgi:glycosyltransferase involved in cell wall biosynthesis
MHVAIDARLGHYTRGGIARYTLELARALADVGPEHRFTLLRSVRRRDGLPGARNLRSSALLTPPHHRWEQFALPLEVARLWPDLLHSPDFIPPFRRPFRAVVTVHDLGFLRFPETLTPESRRYYGQVGRAVHSAERTIAVSHHTARDLVEVVEAPADRVRVIHNGVGAGMRPVEDPAVLRATRARYGLDRPYILFLGTFEPRKNVDTLVRAFQVVRERHDVLLVLAGRRGWLFEPIFELIDRLALRGDVRIVEDVPEDQLPALYSAASAFAYPSLYEGFGLPPLEAMACGTATVVADSAALPETVGDAALLHPPTDDEALTAALLRLLEDESLRAALRARGRERAAGFTWEESARQTLAVYREALGRHPAGA